MYGLKDLEKSLGKITFKQFLKSWRRSEGMSQKEFAEMIQISAANLCDIEKGRKGVSPQKAKDIARKIGYSESILVKIVIQDMLREAGLKFEIELKEKAAA